MKIPMGAGYRSPRRAFIPLGRGQRVHRIRRHPRLAQRRLIPVRPGAARAGTCLLRQDVAVPTYVALLRGINLGGHKKVAMADLRELVTSLGHADVATYIQSGNVVFSTEQSDTAALAAALEEAIAETLGVQARVVVLSREELAQVVRDNPYSGEPNLRAVHAIFLSGQPGPELADQVAAAQQQVAQRGSHDTAEVIGRTIFLHTPDGYGRSDLAASLVKIGQRKTDQVAGTARNWATVTKLAAMCGT
jgi:uncharacterized protein (DUF1697 family)